MKVAIGCDHAGFLLKNKVIEYLLSKNIECKDFGTFSEDSVDYVDYAEKVGNEVSNKNFEFGILICGTGIGISIAANKIKNIRAAVCSDTFSAHSTREHNDANILCLGARVIGEGLALDIVETFLSSSFIGGKHKGRIDKIHKLEN